MTRRAVVKYFNKQWKVMQARLAAFLKTGEQEDLHQFRVQVKKLQAFLILSGYSASQRQRFKSVRKVFKQAGALRNAYIQRELLQQPQADDKTFRDFCVLAKKLEKRFKKVHRALKKSIRPLPDAFICRFCQKELREIAGVLALPLSDKQLHDCRMRIKVLLYDEQLVHNELVPGLNTAYLDQLQEAIGNWHDQRLAAPGASLCSSQKAVIAALGVGFCRRATAPVS